MVYVILAEGFEEIEALTVVDVVRRAGVEVCMVSITSEKAHTELLLPQTFFYQTQTLQQANLLFFPAECRVQ